MFFQQPIIDTKGGKNHSSWQRPLKMGFPPSVSFKKERGRGLVLNKILALQSPFLIGVLPPQIRGLISLSGGQGKKKKDHCRAFSLTPSFLGISNDQEKISVRKRSTT